MRKAKVVRGGDVAGSKKEEPGIIGRMGINSKTVDNPHLTQGHAIIPPSSRNQRHYHVRCDAAMHIVKGRLKMFFGPDHEQEEVIVKTGDFIFVPAGVIHGLQNPSDTEEAELVSSYGGVGSFEDAETLFVEPPWE